jgi:TPR repeat protein
MPRDYQEAFQWFSKAAGQGHPDAQVNLGLMYVRGEGVTKNMDEAVKWFRSSAEQGNSVAQYNLGVCYLQGEGVSTDPQEAYKWLALATSQGDTQAREVLDKLETELTPAQIAEAQKRTANLNSTMTEH